MRDFGIGVVVQVGGLLCSLVEIRFSELAAGAFRSAGYVFCCIGRTTSCSPSYRVLAD